MRLYNQEDIAVKVLKSYSDMEISLGLDKKDTIPDSVRAEVLMIGEKVEGVQPKDIIYYDPAYTHNIKELDIVVLHHKGILLVD